MTEASLGRRGYLAFSEAMEWKNASGEPMPGWERLIGREREAWDRQATVISRAARTRHQSEVPKIHYTLQPGDIRTQCGLVKGGLRVTADCRDVTCKRCRGSELVRRLLTSVGKASL